MFLFTCCLARPLLIYWAVLRNRIAPRVSTEINFADISIGIPIEINFGFRRTYWSKLSKVIWILISILTVEIEIPISNQNIICDLFRWKISIFVWKCCTEIGIPMSESKFRCRNRNSDSKIEIGIPKSKSEFRCRNRNWNPDFDIETEIPILTPKFRRNLV
jgi:hypothetical protein